VDICKHKTQILCGGPTAVLCYSTPAHHSAADSARSARQIARFTGDTRPARRFRRENFARAHDLTRLQAPSDASGA
jgi:hypothetical protein